MDYQGIVIGVFTAVIFIYSAVIHEVMHGAVALLLGDPTAKLAKRLTLNPLKHLDPFGSVILPLLLILIGSRFVFGWAKPVPYNPYNFKKPGRDSVIVALAGPLTNLALAGIFALILRWVHAAGLLGYGNGLLAMALFLVVFINTILAIFNLIPIPPLDGSRLFTLIMGDRMGFLQLLAGRYGLFFLMIIIIPLWMWVFGPIALWLTQILIGPALPSA